MNATDDTDDTDPQQLWDAKRGYWKRILASARVEFAKLKGALKSAWVEAWIRIPRQP